MVQASFQTINFKNNKQANKNKQQKTSKLTYHKTHRIATAQYSENSLESSKTAALHTYSFGPQSCTSCTLPNNMDPRCPSFAAKRKLVSGFAVKFTRLLKENFH